MTVSASPSRGFRVVGLVLSAACSKPRHEGDEGYYLVASNIKIPYWQAAADGLNRAASEMKVTALMVGPDKYDPNGQREQFRGFRQEAVGHPGLGGRSGVIEEGHRFGDCGRYPGRHLDSDAPGSHRLSLSELIITRRVSPAAGSWHKSSAGKAASSCSPCPHRPICSAARVRGCHR